MKNAELIALLIANTNKTRNLRTYGKKWFSGARRICNNVATDVGKMIALIQDKIDHGEIINGRRQSLLIYNFQPLLYQDGAAFITFDMVVKPIEEIHDTHNLDGEPVQIVVDAVTCEVMNNARAIQKMGLDDIDFKDETENPIRYGNYKEYRAVASFITLRHHEKVSADDIFVGMFDHTPIMQSSLAFDSFVEARDYLESNWSNFCFIAEMNYPKEDHPAMLAKNTIGCHIIKLIHPHNPEVIVSDYLTTEPKEDRVDDEVKRMLEAANEAPPEPDFAVSVTA